jgi:hypothetical protein
MPARESSTIPRIWTIPSKSPETQGWCFSLNSGDQTALLSQEGSGIAKRIPRGVVPEPQIFKMVVSEPPRRFAPPLLTQEGNFAPPILDFSF